MSVALKTEKRYTYKDYAAWPDEERWELIDGVAYNMSPAPTVTHQKIVGNFYTILKNKLKGKPCAPFISPTDVVLSEYDVVQPDVLVVCDQSKITEANIQGAPDLVIEVVSGSSALKDRREKKALYEKYGVKEYIIIDHAESYVERFYLMGDNSFSKGEMFGTEEVFTLSSLEEVEIPLYDIFEVKAPEEKDISEN